MWFSSIQSSIQSLIQSSSLMLALAVSTSRGGPNVVVILTDDQGVGDIGSNGNPVLRTPHLDRLASEGVSFERFYVEPVCTPTRAALMTGRSSPRTGAIDTWRGLAMMASDEVTIAEVLRGAGYATGLFGKWHLGDCAPMRPMDQGFDHVLMHRGGGLSQPADAIGNEGRYTDPILFRQGEEVSTTGYCMDVYVDEAIGFMREAGREGRPFFAWVATNTPHTPLHDVPHESYERLLESDLGSVAEDEKGHDAIARTYAMIENIDDNVGRLLDEIDRLHLAEETIVIYLHDNGPSRGRYNAALRGWKSTMYEGGVRTPCFIRWPGHIPPGTTRQEVAAHIDLFPTIAAWCGATGPTDRPLDGRSLARLCVGDDSGWPDDRLVHLQAHRGASRQPRHQFAVIGSRYKVLSNSGFSRTSKPVVDEFELYDLLADPSESTDLAASHPDIVDEMVAAHDAWFEEVTASRRDEPPRIHLGTDAEPTTTLTIQDWRPDDGGWGTSGTWLTSLPADATFEVNVRFRTEVTSPEVVLMCGGLRLEVRRTDQVAEVALGTLSLVRGPHDVHLQIHSSEGSASVRQAPAAVVFRRVD